MVKPVRSETIFARAQIDLINFQTLPDDQYKYIMTYVNHFTKFCVLTPLTSKRAIEVAHALLVVVMEANEDMYKLGCREGKLAQRYSTADLDFVKEPLLKICDVPNIEIALRTAVGKTSGGQGYIKCSCKANCSTLRCSCNKRNMKCNSKCHPDSSCSNIY